MLLFSRWKNVSIHYVNRAKKYGRNFKWVFIWKWWKPFTLKLLRIEQFRNEIGNLKSNINKMKSKLLNYGWQFNLACAHTKDHFLLGSWCYSLAIGWEFSAAKNGVIILNFIRLSVSFFSLVFFCLFVCYALGIRLHLKIAVATIWNRPNTHFCRAHFSCVAASDFHLINSLITRNCRMANDLFGMQFGWNINRRTQFLKITGIVLMKPL